MKENRKSRNWSDQIIKFENDILVLHDQLKNSEYREGIDLLEEIYPRIVKRYSFLDGKESRFKDAYRSLLEATNKIAIRMSRNKRISPELKTELFHLMLEQLNTMVNYSGFAMCGCDDACEKLAIELGEIDALISHIELKMRSYGEGGFCHTEKFRILYSVGRIIEAEAFFNAERNEKPTFEFDVARFLLRDSRNLSMAREIITPYYERSFSKAADMPGSVKDRWHDLMIILCREENDMVQLRSCLIDILLRGDTYVYVERHRELEKLSTPEEWDVLYLQIEAVIKGEDSSRIHPNIFPDDLAYFYADARGKDKLMSLLLDYSIEEMDEFIEYLLPEYEEQIIKRYEEHFIEKLKNEEEIKFMISDMEDIIAEIPSALGSFNRILSPLGGSFTLDGDDLRWEI